jgi:hypothetical protein
MPVQGIHSQPLPLKNSRCWWLTTRNLATWEAEIRRIKVQDQPWGKKKNSWGDPISTEENWTWWHVPVILAVTGSIK